MSAAPKISPEHPLLNREVILNFSNGVSETLKTMTGIESTFEKAFVEKNWKPKTDVSVYLDLQSEPYTGQIRFHFDKLVLASLFEKMLGQAVDPNSSEVQDCIGEISNICYGYAKSKLNERGLSLKMTLPHPCLTKDLPEAVSVHPHIVIPFKVLGYNCYIQIVIF